MDAVKEDTTFPPFCGAESQEKRELPGGEVVPYVCGKICHDITEMHFDAEAEFAWWEAS